MRRLRSRFGLRRDRSGAAAVEFALWSVLVFAVLMVSIDFGFFLSHHNRVASAAAQTAIVAYNRREAGPVNVSALASFLNASAGLPGQVQTSVTCNGADAACLVPPAERRCVCVSGMAPTYAASGACGAPCPSGATSGYYVTIRSEYAFRPIVSPHAFLEDKVIRHGVTVRLQ
jgi:Flp pilus assembly protein TadG